MTAFTTWNDFDVKYITVSVDVPEAVSCMRYVCMYVWKMCHLRCTAASITAGYVKRAISEPFSSGLNPSSANLVK
jgi:hypothetical protein